MWKYHRLVSSDATSLFTKAPFKPILNQAKSILHGNDIALKEFILLVKICLVDNICKFKNKFYIIFL